MLVACSISKPGGCARRPVDVSQTGGPGLYTWPAEVALQSEVRETQWNQLPPPARAESARVLEDRLPGEVEVGAPVRGSNSHSSTSSTDRPDRPIAAASVPLPCR